MLMTPVLSILFGPVPAVVTALLLETAAALVMFPDALPKANVADLAVFNSSPRSLRCRLAATFC